VRAYEAAMGRIYPVVHPFHRLRRELLIASVESLTREDLIAYYRDRYGAATLRLVVVGDIEAPRVLDFLEQRFSRWKPGPDAGIPVASPPPPAPGQETVEMPDKASADVVLACPSDLTRPEPAYLACTLANSALGQSSLTSRLGVRVRDREGLTYGIHSSFHATHVAGPFVVGLTVRPESRAAAVDSALDEIALFLKTGLTEKELADEKSSRVGKYKVDLGSNSGLASAIDAAVYYGLGVGYLDAFPSLVAAVTKDEADAEFRKRVDPQKFTVVSAGSFAVGQGDSAPG
jgi:zinc protease